MCKETISCYTRSEILRTITVRSEKEKQNILLLLDYLEYTEIMIGDEGAKRPVRRETEKQKVV